MSELVFEERENSIQETKKAYEILTGEQSESVEETKRVQILYKEIIDNDS